MTSAKGLPALPSIGRIVFYRLPPPEDSSEPTGLADVAPARVVYVWKGPDQAYVVNLQVDHQDRDGSYLMTGVPYHETETGSWFWPPRVG